MHGQSNALSLVADARSAAATSYVHGVPLMERALRALADSGELPCERRV
jgi:hypothetical protein